MMMMGNMGGSGGGSMMDMDMMNMGGSMGGSAGASMGGGMNASASMQMGPMGGMGQGNMAMDPNAMNGMTGQYGMAAQGSNNILGGLDLTSLLTGLFNFAIDIFAILLVVGLIVGLVVLLKRYLLDNNGLGAVLAAQPKPVCTKCGQTLQTGWYCCPKCGEARAAVQPNTQPQTV